MEVTVIYEDKTTRVVKVDYQNKFLYTRTYKRNDDGFLSKVITVYHDGNVTEDEVQNVYIKF